MGTILKYAIPGLLGLAVASGLIGGCKFGNIIDDKTKALREQPNPQRDRFEPRP